LNAQASLLTSSAASLIVGATTSQRALPAVAIAMPGRG
jgi:hypothetical protein